jgi:hypothetical protein
MAAFVICYIERSPPGAAEAQEAIAQRVAERWDGQLQFNSTWIISTDQTSDHIRDALAPYVRDGDALIIIGAGQDAAWCGFEPADTEWLVEHI